MNIEIHPVIVPETLNIVRDFRTQRRHTDTQPLSVEDAAQYDFRTLFYDVFFNPDNTILYAIGPTFLNFKKELPISALKINAIAIDFTLLEINPKTTLLQANLSEPIELFDENEIRIEFGTKWAWSSFIEKNLLSDTPQTTLSTIQKDNDIRWIKDWIRYYQRGHDIGRTVIYDNNSVYQAELDEKLKAESEHLGVELYTIKWNFPYGPTKSHGNQLCQLGSLNHCRLRFGGSGYCLNFDIDELLVLKSNSLSALLSSSDIVYFDSYMVPQVNQLAADYSFPEFTLRDRLSRLQEGSYKATKYAYRFSGIYANSVHFAVTHRQKKWKYLEKVLKRLKLNALVEYWLDRRFVVPLETGYYLHYSAITSGWKTSARLDVQEDKTDLVEDLAVINILETSAVKRS